MVWTKAGLFLRVFFEASPGRVTPSSAGLETGRSRAQIRRKGRGLMSVFIETEEQLGEEFGDDLAAELGELFEAAGVIVGEAVVVETEEVEEGNVDVADVVDAVDGFGADLVGGADGVSGFHAATG